MTGGVTSREQIIVNTLKQTTTKKHPVALFSLVLLSLGSHSHGNSENKAGVFGENGKDLETD